MSETVKLQKYIADSGLMSRRAAEREIEAGNVTVNGVTARLGDRVSPGEVTVAVGGHDIVNACGEYIYIMLNKPAGVVTTMKDEKGKNRRTVAELVADVHVRVYPVGRLDMFSDGLLLLTNDGGLANALCHPSGNKKKVYRVTLRGSVSAEKLSRLSSPMTITEADGREYTTAPCEVFLVSDDGERTVIEMTLHEGRNRQIRRMCEKLGLTVTRLTRISEGGIFLGGLAPGKWRYLTKEEIKTVKNDNGRTDKTHKRALGKEQNGRS